MKKIVLLMALASVFGISLAGCNTMAGAGQDMQRAGQKMENAAEKKN
jgi:predicted small secreted protein